MQPLTISWAVCARLALIIRLEPKGRRVHVRGAVVRSKQMERRTKVNVPVHSKLQFNSGRIAKTVHRIIYVCIATVDGSVPISGAMEVAPDTTNIFFS